MNVKRRVIAAILLLVAGVALPFLILEKRTESISCDWSTHHCNTKAPTVFPLNYHARPPDTYEETALFVRQPLPHGFGVAAGVYMPVVLVLVSIFLFGQPLVRYVRGKR
jgi:hypothetical protein